MSVTKNNELTVGEISHRILTATNAIQASRKQAMAVYDEDLRALRDLTRQIGTFEMINQPELFKLGNILTPELQRLLEAPLSKYSGL